MIIGTWNTACYWGEFNKTLGEKNVGMFQTPGSPVGTQASFALSIPKSAENKDAAFALIEFLSSKRGLEVMDEYGLLPNRTDVALPKDAPVQAQELVEIGKSGETVPSPTEIIPPPIAFQLVPKELSQLLQGRTDVSSVQKAMQETYEKSN